MNDVSDQLRTALREVADEVDAQVDAGQLSTRLIHRARNSRRPAHNRAWTKPALAAIAVTAVAGVVTALTLTRGSHDGGVATQPPMPTPATSLEPTPTPYSSSNPAPPETPATSASTSAPAATQCLTAQQALAQFAGRPDVVEDTQHGYLCLDGWIYVSYHNTTNGNHSTLLLQYLNGQWALANRVVACPSDPAASPMPAAIYEYGCGN